MAKLNIEPVEGRKLPLEKKPRSYVDKPMTVESTHYYRRALRKGDIALQSAKKDASPKSGGKEKNR